MVSLQRSLGGSAYPEQPRKTPVLAVRICIGRPQALHGMSVIVGAFACMPSGSGSRAFSRRCLKSA
jgi:hypothetical protein